uniref:Uncharacterized protein n=1 Tax=Helianthus annuus TaxID=4232 RepID=A0A251VM99_HELAN
MGHRLLSGEASTSATSSYHHRSHTVNSKATEQQRYWWFPVVNSRTFGFFGHRGQFIDIRHIWLV